MAKTIDQKEKAKWIRQLSHEEVTICLDEAIQLHDQELEDMMRNDWDESRRKVVHPMTGWVRAETVAEVMIYGTSREEAFIQYLANLGLCLPRSQWLHPGEHSGWPQRAGRAKADILVENFSTEFNAFDAIPAAAAALSRTRKQTGWVERHPESGWGWRLTPEGLAHLDGALDQVVSLENY